MTTDVKTEWSESDYDEALVKYIKWKINTNETCPAREHLHDFYTGANTALRELAKEFCLSLD
jgi:hypothetical protein